MEVYVFCSRHPLPSFQPSSVYLGFRFVKSLSLYSTSKLAIYVVVVCTRMLRFCLSH